MLPCERKEGRELEPSATEFLLLTLTNVWIFKETTGIRPYHWNAKHIEVHHTCYRVAHVIPCTVVVSKPMLNVLSWACKGASRQKKSSLILKRRYGFVCKDFSCSFTFWMAKERVSIVLNQWWITGVGSIKWKRHVVKVKSTSWNERKVVCAITISLRVSMPPSVVFEFRCIIL